MAISTSQYLDPGVYIQEVIVPGALSVATVPFRPVVIGAGSRSKRAINEAVTRGLLEGETLSLGSAVTGTGDDISVPALNIQTLTDAAANFTPDVVGLSITIAGSSTTNNGTFTIVARPSLTQVQYVNAAGVADGAFTGTYSIPLHLATLATLGDRRIQNTTVFRDGIAVADSAVAYEPAQITGSVSTSVDLNPNNALALEMDGHIAVTVVFSYAAGSDTVTISGTQINVTHAFTDATLNVVPISEIITALNSALAGASALGYGTAYSTAASITVDGFLRLTSPATNFSSYVRVLPAVAFSATAAIFGSAPVETLTRLRVADNVYSASSTYTINYVSVSDRQDAFLQPGIIDVLKVGSFRSVSNYAKNVDWTQKVATEADEVAHVPGEQVIDWNNVAASGVITSADLLSAVAETYNVSVNDTLRLSIDGKAAVDIDLNGLASPPLGYANPASPAAATAAELAANINAVLTANAAYGARYSTVASNASGKLRLTSPNDGKVSSVSVLHPAANDATTVVFGLSATQTQVVTGTGSRPGVGSVYFVTYSYIRPAADYKNPKTFFSKDTALAFTGPVAADNPLAIAVDIVFRNNNNTSSVMLVQVDDATTPGEPTRQEFLDALDATSERSTATDLIVLSTSLDTQIDLMQNVENQSSLTEKNYRRGWFGMARNTAVGDKDTPGTYVYTATQTLQVAADSPARGRLILAAPPGIEGISRTITLEDGTTRKLDLDSTYLAVAIAAQMSSFLSPSDSLVRKTLSGFDIAEGDFTPWLKGERALLASQGTTVVTFDAGRLILLDPITTEAGGGALVSFEQISASTQKDNLVRKMDQALDSGVIGIVPSDLSDFIIDIKLIIMNIINGEIGSGSIGPFRDDNGATRALDPTKDIVVEQDANDPTKFFFKFFFHLKYPALRLLGQYSVDNPFFVST